jgi:23S rRNA (uridine2479-2'-O)-methyltransferase
MSGRESVQGSVAEQRGNPRHGEVLPGELSDAGVLHAGDGRVQTWLSLLTNRTKRHQRASFVVQGVRPISQALDHGWPLRALLVNGSVALSTWARDVLRRSPAERFLLEPELLSQLGQQEHCPELVAIAELPADDLSRIQPRAGLVIVVDRPTQSGNLGSIIRSADAFGADGVIVTGHGVDPYEPAGVRATTGSLFALPTVHAPAPTAVVAWAAQALPHRQIVGTDEDGEAITAGTVDLVRPTILVLGNETRGMSQAWRAACDQVVRIPMVGAASSLNVANAASILLYEVVRQRTADRSRDRPGLTDGTSGEVADGR